MSNRIKTNDLAVTTDVVSVVVNDTAGATKKALPSSLLPYTVYVCTVTQAGTATLGQTVIHNTTGLTPSWARASTGVYSLDFTGITGTFYSPDITNWTDKSISKAIMNYNGTDTILGTYFYWWDSGNSKLFLYTFDGSGTPFDLNALIGTSTLYLPEFKFYE